MRSHLRYSRLMSDIRRIVQYVREDTDQPRHRACEIVQFRRLRCVGNGGVHLFEVIPEFLEASHSVDIFQEYLRRAVIRHPSQRPNTMNTTDLASDMPVIHGMVAELLE